MKILMWRLTLSLIVVMGAQTISSAQQYCPMPDSGLLWKAIFATFGSNNTGSVTVYDHFMQGDTLIGSNVYTKIFGYDCVYSQQQLCVQGPTAYVGAMRDDSAARKVYYRYTFATADSLLLDFNITVGQPIPRSYLAPNGYIVTSIDSVFFGNKWHRRYHTGLTLGNGDEYMLIEGLGATSGPSDPFHNSGTSLPFLECAYYLNQPVYPDTINGCITLVGITETAEVNILRVMPNPATDRLNIALPDGDNGTDWEITISNISGSIVQTIRTPQSETFSISLFGYSPGVYSITCSGGERIYQSKLVVIPQ